MITGTFPDCKNERRDDVNYKRIGFHIFGARASQLIYQFLLPFQLKNDFDVWIESFTPPISSAFLPMFTSRPIVGLTHLLSGVHMSKKYKLPFWLVEKIALKRYSNIITITPELKHELKNISPKSNITVIPNGIVVEKRKNSKNNRRKHILFIGRLDIYQKGIDLLLTSYKKYSHSIKHPLIIAGHGTDNEISLINNQIRELDLASKVKVIGKVGGSRKARLFRESALTAIPSRFESFGITALEAFYYKSPVICFDIEGFEWINPKLITKVKPFDTNKFGMAIMKLALKKHTNKELIGAYNFSETFKWDRAANDYEKFLKSIITKTN